MFKVLTAQHPAEAHMIRDLLGGDGIDAEVRGELLTGLAGEIPVHEASPTVWIVDETDAEKARLLIESYFSKATKDSDIHWTCPECQETHEGQFTSCWSCGANRPK